MLDLDVIFKRGSIRKYDDRQIEVEKIKTILDAGFAAPSARNLRPYHFILINDRNIIDQISETSMGKRIMKGANLVIAVLGDLNINPAYEFVLNDTSACIQNMLLAIHGLDLGGCWCGQRRDESDIVVKNILKLPDNIFVSGFIALGYKKEEKEQKDRFDETKIHHNTW